MEERPHPFRPAGALPRDPLAAYAGPWDVRQAAHLLRRAGFGGSPADVRRVAQAGMRASVEALVQFPPTDALPALPADLPTGREPLPPAMTAPSPAPQPAPNDSASVEARKERRRLEHQAILTLQQWWLDRMIATPAPLQEKMTLFWHGHFTTAAIQKGVSPADVAAQNALFRSFALGNIRTLTARVAYDPAMLRYLDNVHNEAAHPNENFARELMELYTLGIGNYTETDVREAARAWTGIRVRRTTGEVFVNPRLHDDGSKTFLGRTGDFDGHDIVEILFEQPAAARFFAAKLLGFFMYSDPEPELVDHVAEMLRAHDYEAAPVMTALLSSNVFYSPRAYRALVKSPVEFVVGAYRLFEVPQCDPTVLPALVRMDQHLFFPPNVKGWPGGSTWLNTATMLARENFANALTSRGEMYETSWLSSIASDAPRAADALVDGIVQGDASSAARGDLAAYLAGREDSAPGALSPENAATRVRGAAYLTMAMPAYQLA